MHPVVILSPDPDFAEPLAEQLRAELSLDCRIAGSKDEIKQALAVITTEDVAEGLLPGKLLVIRDRPVKMQDVLDAVAGFVQNQAGDALALGGGYSLQLRQKQLCHGNASAPLTDKEIALLQHLAEAKGQVAAKEVLLKNIWGFDDAVDTHTLETHIYRLRGKFRELSGDDSIIAATEGGYRLKQDDE